MNRKRIRDNKKYLEKENAKYSDLFMEIPKESWPIIPRHHLEPAKVLRSRKFLVVIYPEKNALRISVNRTMINNRGEWIPDISWEELQEVKRLIGYGDHLAVEIYPRDKDVVNVANMRHLWLIDNLEIGWVS